MSFTKRPPRSLIQEFRDFKSVSNATTVEFLGEGELYLSPPLSLSLEENIPSSVTMGKFAAS